MIRSEGQDGLLPASYESGAKTRNRGARRSINPRHCPEVLAFACMHTTPGPVPASRKKGSMMFPARGTSCSITFVMALLPSGRMTSRGYPSGDLGPRYLRRRRLRHPESGHQHRDAAPVLGVPLTVGLDEVPLLESYRDQNLGRGRDREEEMRRSHRRRRPEGEQPADVEGMPHVAVRTGSDEAEWPVLFAPEVEPHLPEPEQVEVVDEEGGDEDGEPAGSEEPVQHGRHHRLLDVPHQAADRSPLPEEKQESDAGREDVCAALGGLGHDARPPALESRARHDAVL